MEQYISQLLSKLQIFNGNKRKQSKVVQEVQVLWSCHVSKRKTSCDYSNYRIHVIYFFEKQFQFWTTVLIALSFHIETNMVIEGKIKTSCFELVEGWSYQGLNDSKSITEILGKSILVWVTM